MHDGTKQLHRDDEDNGGKDGSEDGGQVAEDGGHGGSSRMAVSAAHNDMLAVGYPRFHADVTPQSAYPNWRRRQKKGCMRQSM